MEQEDLMIEEQSKESKEEDTHSVLKMKKPSRLQIHSLLKRRRSHYSFRKKPLTKQQKASIIHRTVSQYFDHLPKAR